MYNQEYQRLYYMKNCEKIKEISRNYRLNNREKLNTAYSCACGGKFTMKNISIHTKSKKHMRYTNQWVGVSELREYNLAEAHRPLLKTI